MDFGVVIMKNVIRTSLRVFNTLAPSNSGTTLQSCYRKHEITKKRAYELRIREVEHSSFTPLVFSASGEWAMKPVFFTSDWRVYCLTNGMTLMPQYYRMD